MDRRRTGAAVLGLATAVALAAVAAGSGPPLRAMRWTAAGGDPVPDMTEAPTECLRPASSTADALRVEVGRAAFRTPVLLGGQAARAGLTCEGCHRSGRNNPAFHFPGVSGAPGTADVTSSLFSSHRGDNLDNPKPIPDLSGPKRGLRIDQSPARPDLERFIHGLVHEEFDGPEPPAEVLAGLAAYVRALDPKACPSAATASLSSGLLMTDARRALAAARAEADRGDIPTAILMVAAARARLGLIDERLDDPTLAPLLRRLRAADARLAGLQAALRAGRVRRADESLVAWLAQAPELEANLARAERSSLFNPEQLHKAVNGRLPG